jgi:hypothetical protein
MRFLLPAIAATVLLAGPASALCPSVEWAESGQFTSGSSTIASVYAVDFDGDSFSDLLSIEDQQLVSRRNAGDGTFEAPVVLLGSVAGRLTLGDLDGDTVIDILAPVSGGVATMIGDGDGFEPPVTFSLDFATATVAAANFDADPERELAALSVSGGFIAIFDIGVSALTELTRVAIADEPVTFVALDYDRDGAQDLFVSQGKVVAGYFGTGTGGFSSPVTNLVGNLTDRLVVGDADVDGHQDVLASGTAFGGEIVDIRLYRGGSRETDVRSGHAWPPELFQMTAGDVVAGDFTGDGEHDVALVANGQFIATFSATETGSYEFPSWVLVKRRPLSLSIAAGDFDGDGLDELIAGSGSEYLLYEPECESKVFAYPHAITVSTGDPIRFDVRIGGFPRDSGGTVTLRLGSTVADTEAVYTKGDSSLQVSNLAAGEYEFTVDFSGNASLPASTSDPILISVVSATTQTTIHLPPQAAVYGTPRAIEVEVTGAGVPSSGVPVVLTGLGYGPITHRTGSPYMALLGAGEYQVGAEYAGDDVTPASKALPVMLTISKATVDFDITGPVAVRAGQSFTFHYRVTGPYGPVEGGRVRITGPGGELTPREPLVNGEAQLSLELPLGRHTIQHHYTSDANHKGATTEMIVSVLPDGASPITIDAVALPSHVVIGYLLPDEANPSSLQLSRRQKGTSTWAVVPDWDPATGITTSTPRGVVHEFRLDGALTDSTPITSNVSSAILFSDEPVTAGMTVRFEHFAEMEAALNIMRTEAGLLPFALGGGFARGSVVFQSQLNALRNGIHEVRMHLGQPAPVWQFVDATRRIKAIHVMQTRDYLR